jgi:hypothetical protein
MTGRERKRAHFRKRHAYLDGLWISNHFYLRIYMHCGQFLAKRKGCN